METVPYLKSLQALELAVRTGSLRAAADRLAITPAAVGQRIKTLEDYLGMDLLVRGRHGITPTAQLARAMPHLAAAFESLEKVREILDFQRVHEIHVVADLDWADLWLKPRLPMFREQNPNILFCINGVGDVPTRLGQKDCEIWFAAQPGDGSADLLFRDYLLPICSWDNVQRIARTPDAERLEGIPLIHLDCHLNDPGSIGWPEWIRTFGHRKTAAGRGIRYPHAFLALDAVQSDVGFLICGLSLVSQEIENGKLALPFPVCEGAWTGSAYLARFRPSARPQLQLFRRWLLEESERTISDLRRLVPHAADAAAAAT